MVEYPRVERSAGKSKFNGWKLWNLALEGIISFSTVPLRIWTYLGCGVATFAFLYAAWLIIDKLIWMITEGHRHGQADRQPPAFIAADEPAR